jgi:hypothetical protein
MSYVLNDTSTIGNISSYGNITVTVPNYSLSTIATSTSNCLSVTGDADFAGSLTVQGVDIKQALEQIQNRLLILVPDPALLEKYEALKQAYDNYKLLEALCVDESNKIKR